MTRTAQVPLADLLTVTTGWMITPDAPVNLVQLVQHVVQTPDLNPFSLPAACEATKQHLLRTMPWLAGITIPSWMEQEDSNLKLWCWLDTQEMRHGTWHAVESMESGTWQPPALTGQLQYYCPDGHLHTTTYDELPEALKEYLKTLGMQPE